MPGHRALSFPCSGPLSLPPQGEPLALQRERPGCNDRGNVPNSLRFWPERGQRWADEPPMPKMAAAPTQRSGDRTLRDSRAILCHWTIQPPRAAWTSGIHHHSKGEEHIPTANSPCSVKARGRSGLARPWVFLSVCKSRAGVHLCSDGEMVSTSWSHPTTQLGPALWKRMPRPLKEVPRTSQSGPRKSITHQRHGSLFS